MQGDPGHGYDVAVLVVVFLGVLGDEAGVVDADLAGDFGGGGAEGDVFAELGEGAVEEDHGCGVLHAEGYVNNWVENKCEGRLTVGGRLEGPVLMSTGSSDLVLRSNLEAVDPGFPFDVVGCERRF